MDHPRGADWEMVLRVVATVDANLVDELRRVHDRVTGSDKPTTQVGVNGAGGLYYPSSSLAGVAHPRLSEAVFPAHLPIRF